MKLLIGGSNSKFFHLQEFSEMLQNYNIETKLVFDADYADGFPSRKISNWFKPNSKFDQVINDFEPDVIFVDRQRHFGLEVIKKNIPLLVHLRGDHWAEIKMAKETLYSSPPKKIAINRWEGIANQVFDGSKMILPICKYLENIVKNKYPQKSTDVLYQGITPENWYRTENTNLNHPCVGILQGAVIWEKTKELLTLTKVLEKMPEVTFYWAGDGPYREKVLPHLEKYENFKWLGALDYPEKVRDFLSEIDVYLLLSGIDMSPLTLLEAQLMEKPVIATNVGGIPELMKDNESGFLVNKHDHQDLHNKLELILTDSTKAVNMGKKGKEFVSNNFSWKKIAKDFITITKDFVD